DDANIPYLLPKSYENLKVPRVFKNPAFSYNVDIQHFIYIENQFFVSMIDSNDVLNEICKVIPNPHDYISVCSLRGNDILCGKLVSELIYVHCKLLIVDDEH
ncbi:hypothetical protein OSTOST_25150, partial [Ostertagia ostertagi]